MLAWGEFIKKKINLKTDIQYELKKSCNPTNVLLDLYWIKKKRIEISTWCHGVVNTTLSIPTHPGSSEGRSVRACVRVCVQRCVYVDRRAHVGACHIWHLHTLLSAFYNNNNLHNMLKTTHISFGLRSLTWSS